MEVFLHQLGDLIPVVFTLLAGVLARYAVPFLKNLVERSGLELESRQEAYIQHVVKQAVLAAEETVEAAYKAKVVQYGEKADEKLNSALKAITEKLPFLTEDQQMELIHAALKQMQLGASASVPLVKEQLEQLGQPKP